MDPQTNPISELTAVVTTLNASVTGLDKRFQELDERLQANEDLTKRTQTLSNILIAVVVVLALAVAGMIWLAVNTRTLANENAANIAETRKNTDRIAILGEKGICAYNNLFLGSVTPQSRDRYPQGPEAFDFAIQQLRQVGLDVNCAPVKR